MSKKIYTQEDFDKMMKAETKMTLAIINDLLKEDGTKRYYTTSIVNNKIQSTALLILEAKEEVKEECAKIAEEKLWGNYVETFPNFNHHIMKYMRKEIAKAIRDKRYLITERVE